MNIIIFSGILLILFLLLIFIVYTQLLMLRQPPNELLMAFSSLCERAETMEDGFTDEQKRKLNMWKNQLLKADSFPVYNADAITLKSQRYVSVHSNQLQLYS